MATEFDILTGTEYYAELMKRFDRAGKHSRILLQSMSFDPDDSDILAVMYSLLGAAKRGADVTFMIDAISFMIHDGKLGPLWYKRKLGDKLPEVFQRKRDWFDRLNAQPNTRAVIMNRPSRPFTLHVAGRTHIKAAVIDDLVIIPCANLDNPSYINLAVRYRDAKQADWLYDTLRSAADSGSVVTSLDGKDERHRINDSTLILIDAGVRRQSVIHEEAIKLIDAAQQWLTITCQYFPGGETGRHLQGAARRGVDVRVIFSPPSHHHGPVKLMNQANLSASRARLPANLFKHILAIDSPRMHAKLIASDAGILIGSHNYVNAGVQLGTAEIALLSTSESLASKAANRIG